MMTSGRLKGEKEKAETERSKKRTEEHEHAERELIPDISNDITLHEISTKLPWSAVQAISSVSRPWRQAVHSREVYEARVRSSSTETLLVISNTLSDQTNGIAVYSLESRASYQLPPIPHLESGIPESCECITLDGKIFVLGGLKDSTTEEASQDVFMLDMAAGQREWKQCASMRFSRKKFGCGVINGKFYACGGSSRHTPVCETEVYDPEVDVWTELSPMPSKRVGHDVGVIEGELVAYGGSVFRPNFLELQDILRRSGRPEVPEIESLYVERAVILEMYNPITDEWRRLSKDYTDIHYTDSRWKKLFLDGREMLSVYEDSI